MNRPIRRAAAPFLALAALAACHGKGGGDRPVRQPWVSLPAVPGRPGAAYFTLSGEGGARVLTGVRSALVQRIELHAGGMHGGMMTMRPLPRAEVAAGATRAFAPKGDHAMLFGIDPAIRPGTAIPLRFDFADGTAFEAEAKTVGPGEAAPY
ncbi:MAG: copper chaperone PCu(A)C [Sphingomonas fennica]